MNTATASLPPAKSAAQIALITQSRRWLAPVLAQTLKAWLTGADEAPQGQVEGDDAGGTPAAAKARQRALPPEQPRQTQALLAALLDSATAVTQATPAACPPLFWAETLASAMQPVQAAEQWRQTAWLQAVSLIDGQDEARQRPACRALFQKGLLGWLRAADEAEAQAARADMQTALSAIRLLDEAPGAPSFWGERQILLQAQPIPPDDAARRQASQIDAALRQWLKGSTSPSRTLPGSLLTLAANLLDQPADLLAVLTRLKNTLPRSGEVDQRRVMQVLDALAQQQVDKLGQAPAGWRLEIGLALSLLREGPLTLSPEEFAQSTDSTVARLVQLLGGQTPSPLSSPSTGQGWLADERARLEHQFVSAALAEDILGLMQQVEALLATSLANTVEARAAASLPDRETLAAPLTTLAGLLSRMGHFSALGHLRRLTTRLLALVEADAMPLEDAARYALLGDWARLSLFIEALTSGGPLEFNAFIAGLPDHPSPGCCLRPPVPALDEAPPAETELPPEPAGDDGQPPPPLADGAPDETAEAASPALPPAEAAEAMEAMEGTDGAEGAECVDSAAADTILPAALTESPEETAPPTGEDLALDEADADEVLAVKAVEEALAGFLTDTPPSPQG